MPSDLPSSLEDSYGHVRYTAVVTLNFADHPIQTFEENFTIIKPFDLNSMPSLRVSHRRWENQSKLTLIFQDSAVRKTSRNFGFCCWMPCSFDSEPLRITARTPVSGYTPGQMINLEIKADNDSDTAVERFTVQLLKVSSNRGGSENSHKSIVESYLYYLQRH